MRNLVIRLPHLKQSVKNNRRKLGLLPRRAWKNCREISFLYIVELEHKEAIEIEKLNNLIGLVLFSIICGITIRSTRRPNDWRSFLCFVIRPQFCLIHSSHFRCLGAG